MIQVELGKLCMQFLQQGADYLESPSVMKALELEDISGKLMHAANHQRGDAELAGVLHDLRQALRSQQVEQLQQRFEQARTIIHDHGLNE